MTGSPGDSVVILFKGGRLPTWHLLDEAHQADYERQHVDLMLSVSERHGLMGLHGYRLLAPLGDWVRFWTVEFPDLAGAEAWMEAEVEPPYGRYGFHDYSLARRWQPESLSWLPRRPEPPVPPDADPHVIAPLSADPSSIVVLAFGGWRRGSDEVDPRTRGDEERGQRLREVAGEHGLLHGEVFRLLGDRRRGRAGLDPRVSPSGRRRGLDRGGGRAARRRIPGAPVPPGPALGAGVLRHLASAEDGRLKDGGLSVRRWPRLGPARNPPPMLDRRPTRPQPSPVP